MDENNRILVVDDETVVLDSLERILEGQGYEVHTARSADDALSLLERGFYALVLTDLMMPGMDGLELIEETRSRGHDVPFIMVTGYATIRTAVEALRVGASDYVTKPFTRQEIKQAVLRAFKLKEHGDREEAGHATRAEREDSDTMSLAPGDVFTMTGHAWAEYVQDGTFRIGMDRRFMKDETGLSSIELPREGEIIEQGYPMLNVRTTSGTLYTVFSPLTGQVVEVAQRAAEQPESIDAKTWLLTIIPSNLKDELGRLSRLRR